MLAAIPILLLGCDLSRPEEVLMKAYEIDGIKRPTKRSECIDGPRPCPWVSCRHHLLLEVASAAPKINADGVKRDARPTTIRLNMASQSGDLGRRPGLLASAPAEIVRQWITDAVDHLDRMEWTCALDVAEAHEDGLPLADTAKLLGVTTAAIRNEVGPVGRTLRRGLADYEDHAPMDLVGNLARAQAAGTPRGRQVARSKGAA